MVYKVQLQRTINAGTDQEEDVDVDVEVEMECTYRGRPATGPSYASGGEPAEAPEFEYASHSAMIGDAPTTLTDEELTKAIELAYDKAAEEGPPEPDYDEPDYDDDPPF